MTITLTDSVMSLNDQVAEEIRSWMGRRRMSQAALGRALNENEMWVSRRLRGLQDLTLTDMQRIATALGVTPIDLIPRSVRGMQDTGPLVAPPIIQPERRKRPAGRPADHRPSGRPTHPNVRPGENGLTRPATTSRRATRLAA
jgi:transcriptional regulator with XRE-family HTH domain